jgi:anti-sigma B factor antagonist
MSMTAHINTDVNGNIVIQMRGGINYETSDPLKKELEYLMKAHPTSSITLDFQCVEFVGSSGIGNFVETINHLNSKVMKIFLTNVRSEFIKVFKLYQLTCFDYHLESEEETEAEAEVKKAAELTNSNNEELWDAA